jgi:hypothetical protein
VSSTSLLLGVVSAIAGGHLGNTTRVFGVDTRSSFRAIYELKVIYRLRLADDVRLGLYTTSRS